ncbi:beta propeller repeat protein, partial [Actinocorallia lasiicapitis]
VAGRPLVFASTDAGRTWRQSEPPGAPAAVTALTATGKGWLAAGARDGDVLTWTSDDGLTWQAASHTGGGLDGPGDQHVTTLAVLAGNLTAITVSDGVDPYLWHPTEGA